MPESINTTIDSTIDTDAPSTPLPKGCEMAIAAEAFYVTNMVLAPGLGFLMLMMLYFHCSRKEAPAMALNHLRQTLAATFWTTIFAALFLGLIFATGGYPSPWFWTLLTTYFLAFHLPLTAFGVIGLGRALGGRSYHYPLFGMKLMPDAPAPA